MTVYQAKDLQNDKVIKIDKETLIDLYLFISLLSESFI